MHLFPLKKVGEVNSPTFLYFYLFGIVFLRPRSVYLLKTIVSRRYLGCVLYSLMYRYGGTLSESVSETDMQVLGVGTQFRKNFFIASASIPSVQSLSGLHPPHTFS